MLPKFMNLKRKMTSKNNDGNTDVPIPKLLTYIVSNISYFVTKLEIIFKKCDEVRMCSLLFPTMVSIQFVFLSQWKGKLYRDMKETSN